MDHRDMQAWDAQEPPEGFAESRRRGGEARRGGQGRAARGARLRGAAPGGGGRGGRAASACTGRRAGAHGDVTAGARQEVRVGTRALAVLEKGAHVSWDGDAIEQAEGDVFWRVEPGARFVVHTPAADVAVKGTCFRVRVGRREGEMNGRDAKSGAVGAVVARQAFVGVYEGKVAVSHAGQSVDLTAGQSARGGAARRACACGGGPDEEASPETAAASASEGEQALTEANANLADDVRAYRRKLEAIEGRRRSSRSSSRRRRRSSRTAGWPRATTSCRREDWKELAKEGEVRMRVPVRRPEGGLQPDGGRPRQARPRAAGRADPPGGVPAVARAHVGVHPAALQPGPRRGGRDARRAAGVREHPDEPREREGPEGPTTRTCATWRRSSPGRGPRPRQGRRWTRW